VLGAVAQVDPSAVSDPERFRRDVAESCEPAVLRGACSDWPALEAAQQSWNALVGYLAQFDNGVPAQAFIGDSETAGRYFYRDDFDGFNFAREDLRVTEALERIGKAHGKTASQVALRWLVQQGIMIIPGSGTPARQKENFDVLDFSLTPAEMTEIAGLKRPNSRVVNPPQHPDWDV